MTGPLDLVHKPHNQDWRQETAVVDFNLHQQEMNLSMLMKTQFLFWLYTDWIAIEGEARTPAECFWEHVHKHS